jgi:hypothetical protein
MRYILVAGTHGASRDDDFDALGSEFRTELNRLGLQPVSSTPFLWSTDIDGLWGKNIQWAIGGANLLSFAVPPLCPERAVPSKELLVIAFSHGAQVALHAFASGLKGRLITVNPPIRDDMEPVISHARTNIVRWVNIYGDWRDVWVVLGALRDGHFGIRRQFEQADANLLVEGGHGSALRNPEQFHHWQRILDEVAR